MGQWEHDHCVLLYSIKAHRVIEVQFIQKAHDLFSESQCGEIATKKN